MSNLESGTGRRNLEATTIELGDVGWTGTATGFSVEHASSDSSSDEGGVLTPARHDQPPVVAEPVDEEEENIRISSKVQLVLSRLPVVVAEPMISSTSRGDSNEFISETINERRVMWNKNTKVCLWLFVALAIAVVLAVGVSVPVALSSSSDSSSASSSASSSTKTTDSFPTASPTIDGPGWKQLGEDIAGLAAGDRFGRAVALSANGLIMAAGAHWNDDNAEDAGHVRVFSFDNSSQNWEQMGRAIGGEATRDEFGESISLSSDGAIVAAGAPLSNLNGTDSGHVRTFVYDSSSQAWKQLGQTLQGETAGDQFGTSVAISSNGYILAAGAPINKGNGFESGRVRVFAFNNSIQRWEQLGQNIDGKAIGDRVGFSVALSANGMILAAGAYYNDGAGDRAGHVRVFSFYNGTRTWEQLGKDIEGEAAGDEFSYSMALSSSGMILAVGAQRNKGNGIDSGQVRTYFYNDSSLEWEQLGQEIEGEAPEDRFGHAVAISSDGMILAAGAALNDGNQRNSGHVRIYSFNTDSQEWEKIDQDLDGEAPSDNFGASVAMSADAAIVAAGAPGNDERGDCFGHVLIYRWE